MPSTIPPYPNSPENCWGQRRISASPRSGGKTEQANPSPSPGDEFDGAQLSLGALTHVRWELRCRSASSWLTESSDCLPDTHSPHSRGGNNPGPNSSDLATLGPTVQSVGSLVSMTCPRLLTSSQMWVTATRSGVRSPPTHPHPPKLQKPEMTPRQTGQGG